MGQRKASVYMEGSLGSLTLTTGSTLFINTYGGYMNSLAVNKNNITLFLRYISHITETMMEQKKDDSKFVRQY